MLMMPLVLIHQSPVQCSSKMVYIIAGLGTKPGSWLQFTEAEEMKKNCSFHYNINQQDTL